MHSSRMHTARSPSMHCAGGVGGGLLPGGVCSGGSLPRGVSAPEGVSAPGGWSAPKGVSAPRGDLLSQHALRQTPSPVNRMTDRQV